MPAPAHPAGVGHWCGQAFSRGRWERPQCYREQTQRGLSLAPQDSWGQTCRQTRDFLCCEPVGGNGSVGCSPAWRMLVSATWPPGLSVAAAPVSESVPRHLCSGAAVGCRWSSHAAATFVSGSVSPQDYLPCSAEPLGLLSVSRGRC